MSCMQRAGKPTAVKWHACTPRLTQTLMSPGTATVKDCRYSDCTLAIASLYRPSSLSWKKGRRAKREG